MFLHFYVMFIVRDGVAGDIVPTTTFGDDCLLCVCFLVLFHTINGGTLLAG